MKRILSQIYAPVVAVLWNLLLVYLVYQVARLAYYAENASLFSPLFGEGMGDVFRGGLLFDTSAIIYTNALYILLMLLPWHKKEHRGYQPYDDHGVQ